MDSFPSHLSVEMSSSLCFSASSSSGGSHQFFGLLVFFRECSPLVLNEWCRYSELQFGAIFRGPVDLCLGSEASGPTVSFLLRSISERGFSVLQIGAVFRGPGDLGLGSETAGPPVSFLLRSTSERGFWCFRGCSFPLWFRFSV